jgi:hypothetical protein
MMLFTIHDVNQGAFKHRIEYPIDNSNVNLKIYKFARQQK